VVPPFCSLLCASEAVCSRSRSPDGPKAASGTMGASLRDCDREEERDGERTVERTNAKFRSGRPPPSLSSRPLLFFVRHSPLPRRCAARKVVAREPRPHVRFVGPLREASPPRRGRARPRPSSGARRSCENAGKAEPLASAMPPAEPRAPGSPPSLEPGAWSLEPPSLRQSLKKTAPHVRGRRDFRARRSFSSFLRRAAVLEERPSEKELPRNELALHGGPSGPRQCW